MTQTKTLSLIIPCYNEAATLAESLRRMAGIAGNSLSLEFIVVDDASHDSSASIVEEFAKQQPNVRLFRHPQNRGKGAALQLGFSKATGDYVVIQDADLEYNPQNLLPMVQLLIEDKADIVYGSRFKGGAMSSMPYGWQHKFGNQLLTFCSNVFTGLWVSDMETCYKMFRREIIQSIPLCENRFGIEPEITAKLGRYRLNGRKLRFAEVPIEYHGRTYAEGKKIGLRDAVRAFYCIIKYRFF